MSPAPTLVLLIGPAAAGKSTIADALAVALRGDGETVASISLDTIAEMALPTLPSWDLARSIFGSVVGAWLDASVPAVVAEGISSQTEVEDVLAAVRADARVLRVAITTPYEVAIERAQRDPSRVATRDPEFLRGVYQRWSAVSASLAADVSLDTSTTSIEACVGAIRSAIEA